MKTKNCTAAFGRNSITRTFDINYYRFSFQLLITESGRVLRRIPIAFKPLMSPHLAKVDAAIEPGLTMLNWTSLSLDTYIDSVYDSLKELELLIDRANDLVKFRIEAVLQEMCNTTLCQLPIDAPWTIEKFLKSTEVLLLVSVPLTFGPVCVIP